MSQKSFHKVSVCPPTLLCLTEPRFVCPLCQCCGWGRHSPGAARGSSRRAWAGGPPESEAGQKQCGDSMAIDRSVAQAVFPPLSSRSNSYLGIADLLPHPCVLATLLRHPPSVPASGGRVAWGLSLLCLPFLPFLVMKYQLCCVAHLAQACVSGLRARRISQAYFDLSLPRQVPWAARDRGKELSRDQGLCLSVHQALSRV